MKNNTNLKVVSDQKTPAVIIRPVDVYVGLRLRQRRTLLGLSQEKLGEGVGLTFQQIQKYERGANRIGASRLFQLSQILEVEVGYFFDEMPTAIANTNGTRIAPSKNKPQPAGEPKPDPMIKRETLELVRAYYKIKSEKVRKRIFELTKSIANMEA